MKIDKLHMENYKIFKDCSFDFEGKSAVIFGVNGTGKSTILSAVNYLFRVWINRLNPTQGKSYASFLPEMVHDGRKELKLACQIDMAGEKLSLERIYQKPRTGKKQAASYDLSLYKIFTEKYNTEFLETDETNIPIFINYGTNRSVLDIPLRIRGKHEFSRLSSMEYAVENTVSFRTFFEWYRNQEDLENQIAKEKSDLNYQDIQMVCVRRAIETMLGNVSNLRVRRNPLCMVVNKNGHEIRVDMLSDGEKCTIALLGDLSRRLAIANPSRENPLEGEGIVLIDEVELHMHPRWQRKILPVLKQLFPNIQFIITTHSPQVLGEVDASYKIFLLNEESADIEVRQIERMDGFDSNMILEEYMNTSSASELKKNLVLDINTSILLKKYEDAEKMLKQLADCAGTTDEDYVMSIAFLKRSRLIDAKNR